jgi:hypothetical protein
MTDNANAGAGSTENTGAGNNAGGTPWYGTTTQPEIVAHLQTHGWDKLTPTEAALKAAQSHYSAAKLIGRDPATLIPLPKNAADEAGWATVYDKLGVPKDVTAYKFEGLKFADGKELDKPFTDWLAQQSLDLKLDPNRAKQFAQNIVKHMDGIEAGEKAETTAKTQEEVTALKTNWGKNWDANLFVAKRAAEALGITPETVATLQNLEGVGYAKVMEMFRTIGEKMGEDTFVRNTNPANGGVMSKDQAIARRSELMTDKAWVERYSQGGKTELREMMAVNAIIVGTGATGA